MEEIITVNGQQYKLNTSTTLTQTQRNEIIDQLYEKNTILTLAPNYSTVQGTTKNIVINASSGTAPYKYTIIMDTTNVAINVSFTGTTISVPHLFNESVGTHTLKVYVTDSCATGVLTSNTDTSTITITAPCTVPVCSFTVI